MVINIRATPKFTREAHKAMTAEVLQDLIDALVLDPEKGVLLKETGGI